MQIPWLTRPPTPEEVAAHAKAYPLSANSCAPTGRWLFVRDDGVAYFVMLMIGLRLEVLREYEQRARWLPCTPEGIPVSIMAAFANWVPALEKALEHLTEALALSVDLADDIPITRAEVRKARDLLAALRQR